MTGDELASELADRGVPVARHHVFVRKSTSRSADGRLRENHDGPCLIVNMRWEIFGFPPNPKARHTFKSQNFPLSDLWWCDRERSPNVETMEPDLDRLAIAILGTI